jgi:hypothetical protein
MQITKLYVKLFLCADEQHSTNYIIYFHENTRNKTEQLSFRFQKSLPVTYSRVLFRWNFISTPKLNKLQLNTVSNSPNISVRRTSIISEHKLTTQLNRSPKTTKLITIEVNYSLLHCRMTMESRAVHYCCVAKNCMTK